jgi:hypothetical protein
VQLPLIIFFRLKIDFFYCKGILNCSERQLSFQLLLENVKGSLHISKRFTLTYIYVSTFSNFVDKILSPVKEEEKSLSHFVEENAVQRPMPNQKPIYMTWVTYNYHLSVPPNGLIRLYYIIDANVLKVLTVIFNFKKSVYTRKILVKHILLKTRM